MSPDVILAGLPTETRVIRSAPKLRLLSGASLLVLSLGLADATAQSVATDPVMTPDLRGSIAADNDSAASDNGANAEEAPVERLRDGDIAVTVEPAAPPDEPVDVDTQPNPDGDLQADGQADVIGEAAENDGADEAPIDAPDAVPAETAEEEALPPAAVTAATEDPAPPSVEPALRSAYPENDENPYAPIGYRIGSFILLPELAAEAIVDDNVFRSGSNRRSDQALGLRQALRVTSDWSRHALEADVVAFQSFYQTYSGENDRAVDAALRGRADITSDTRLDATLGYQLSQESRGTIDFPAAAGERPDVVDRTAGLALTQRFNRLSARLRGTVTESRRSGAGLDASEDYVERELGLRIGYEVSPGLQLFGEHDWTRRSYAAAASDALLRDADGRTLRAGFAAEISAKLRGELSFGKRIETPDADTLAAIEGLIADGSLTWTPSALTTVTLGATSAIAPTSLAESSGALERSADLEVRHEFRRYLAAIAGLGYTSRDYAGTRITEEEITASLGLEYFAGRGWVVGADYAHTAFWSSEPEGDYAGNVFRLTGKWQP